MNRHSLIFYFSSFFLFLMMVINSLFYLQFRYDRDYLVENSFKVFHESRQLLRMSRQERLSFDETNARLYDIFGVEMLREEEAGAFREGRVLGKRRDITSYAYQGEIYVYFHDKRRGIEHIFRYKDEKVDSKRIVLFTLCVDLAVILFFLYVIRRIWPLRELKTAISEFSQGNLDIHTNIKGKDEIADVANEFDHAIAKIKQLQGSRNLFLRNIMHELKTPIAKGKLITDLLDDEKNTGRLRLIFSRFEHLLNEFAKIERVTSNEFTLNKKRFRVVDIVDNALDILMVGHEAVILHIEAESEIEADFELFSVALKNLIDNAIKYGKTKPEILIEKSIISIISTGEHLDENVLENVFNRKFEDSSKGLGLGLYITKNIVEKHGFNLKYSHQEGKNRFVIEIKN